MNVMKKKLGKKGGFTLVEMLIVVAIIAILIAISIPLVNSALEKARDATDDANYRSAVALGTIEYLTNQGKADGYYWYIAGGSGNTQGTLSTKSETKVAKVTGAYESKCTKADGTEGDTKTSSGKYILVHINSKATSDTEIVTVTWDDGTAGG